MAKKRKKRPVESYIIAALRKIWFYSELRQNAAKAVKFDGMYQCASCNNLFEKIQIDHISPVGGAKNKDGIYDWNVFINRLFCSPDNLQALCHNCHVSKTQVDNNLIKIKKLKNKVVKKKK